jgi:hypothetical protein
MTETYQSQPKYGQRYGFNKLKTWFDSRHVQEYFIVSEVARPALGLRQLFILSGNQGFLPGNRAVGCDAEYHLHLASKIRVSGAVTLHSPHTKHSWCTQGQLYVFLFSNLLLRENVHILVGNNLRLLALHLK